jgi:hypothetical protein
MNQMFLHKNQPKHGIIVRLPKSNGDRTPNGYRPISLPTTEYKLLARIIARRLRHVLKDHLQTSQFCGVSGNSILEAASLVRDVIAYLESSVQPFVYLPSISNTPLIYLPSLPLSNPTPIWHRRVVHREGTRPIRKRHGLSSN